tara:strand:+ start:5789 stop:6514 length:726 start_codon:yes stop_codon:yes gene_type:complete
MNIFPTRKTSIDTYYIDNDFKNYKKSSENTVAQFPNPKTYMSLNEQLLKSYLKINKRTIIEKKVEQHIEKKVEKNTSAISQLENDIHNLNTSIHINNKSYNLFIFEVDQSKSLNEHLDYIHNENFYLIFDLFNSEYMKEIVNANKIGEMHIKEIIKLIFLNFMDVQLIPNFCNLWIFGQQDSIICQGTYLPVSEGSYSDEDYLDLITNVVVKSYLKLDEKSVYDAINTNKSNEQLYFLAFK